jgi:hypothetical protein
LLVVAAFLGISGASSLLAQPPASGLSQAQFEKLFKELQPSDNELWRSIPWETSIVEGRYLAAKNKKPIFVWVASGEPLGCG